MGNLVIATTLFSLVIGFLLGMYVNRDKNSWIHKQGGIDQKIVC